MKKNKIIATHVTIKLFSNFQSSTNQLIVLVANVPSTRKKIRKISEYGGHTKKCNSHWKMVDEKGDALEFLHFISFMRESFNHLTI